ncbi:unnamed protein product [Ectocarpus sp. 4 AP-2014]
MIGPGGVVVSYATHGILDASLRLSVCARCASHGAHTEGKYTNEDTSMISHTCTPQRNDERRVPWRVVHYLVSLGLNPNSEPPFSRKPCPFVSPYDTALIPIPRLGVSPGLVSKCTRFRRCWTVLR